MQSLLNKNIVLGVTGGVAAYKSAQLVRCLRQAGAHVRVVMTRAAQAFITPLTLQALSGYPVSTDLLDPQAEAAMGHIELARWADLIVVAPATADFIAKLAHGHADDLLCTLCLATEAKISVVPAMNQKMWHNSITQDNLHQLTQHEICLLGPSSGEQACGDFGLGRMLEPEAIVDALKQGLPSVCLSGKTVVITAGPTREAIDPVRFISNHSSGKMGYALAEVAAEAGAVVKLISGPVNGLSCPQRVRCTSVVSGQQMYEAAMAQIQQKCDIFIACAAPTDYRCATIAEQKIKRSEETRTLQLVPNPDLLAEVAKRRPSPFTVGFAAETTCVIEHARAKRGAKKVDMMIANKVGLEDRGFASDENEVTVITPQKEYFIPLASKRHIAWQIIKIVADTL